MKPINFKNKVVLITGASSGIGKEFAKNLASQGANLIITARSNLDLIDLAKELESQHSGIWVKTIPLDLTQLKASETLFSSIVDMGLSVDYLINNAGFGKFCEFSEETFETYHNMLMLNINALVELTHLCLPNMKKNNSGGIINVASTASFQPLPYLAVYAASKAFVLSFSEALSGELLDTNIHIMALCPGPTESRFMTEANADTSSMKLASSKDVVNSALASYSKHHIYTVSGAINYLMSLIPRLVSRKLAIKITANISKNRILKK
jgi:short-subunit dehydrogenase